MAGKLYFFESGTDDEKDTFADVNETTKNTNPVILNGDGTTPNIFYSGAAKVIRTDADDVQVWSRDPVTAAAGAGQIGSDWDAISVYNINDVVDFGGELYVSIINNNQNNNPASTTTAWTLWYLLKSWNTNETYDANDPVLGSDGIVYTSIAGSNQGNNPTSTSGFWKQPSASGISATPTDPLTGTDVQSQLDEIASILSGNKNYLINARGQINQEAVTGSVVLLAGEYGHDMFQAGASGCEYTFSVTEETTEFTITAGTFVHIVDGDSLPSLPAILSWEGTVEAQIDGGGFAASPITTATVGGTNLRIEFGTGTLSLPQLNPGDTIQSFDYKSKEEELPRCQWYFQKSYNQADAPGSITLLESWAVANSRGTFDTLSPLILAMRTVPTVVIWSPDNGFSGWVLSGATNTTVTESAATETHLGAITISGGEGAGVIVRYHFTADSRLS